MTSWLLYFAALIVTAMVSVSFGSYGSALFFDDSTAWSKVLTTAEVLAVAAINIAGARFIDRAQTAIVIVLLAVFAVFIVVTLAELDPGLLGRRRTRRRPTSSRALRSRSSPTSVSR